MKIVEHPSPNSAERTEPVDILVLHYTELPLKESLDILSDGTFKEHVSLAQTQPNRFRAICDTASVIQPLAVNEGTNRIAKSQIGLGIKDLLAFGHGHFNIAAAHSPQFDEAKTLFASR